MSNDAANRRTGRAHGSGFLGYRSRPCGGIGPVVVVGTARNSEWWNLAWSVAFVVLLLVAVTVVRVDAQPDSDRLGRLFVAAESPTAHLTIRPDAAVLRERLVRLDHDVLAAARMNAGRTDVPPAVLRLDLFDDVALHAVVERTGPTSAGYWLSGRIEEWALGSVTLVANDDVIAGTVRAPSGTYAIRSVGDGVHAIRQLDPAAPLTFKDDSLGPSPATDEPGRVQPIHLPVRSTKRQAQAPQEEDGSRIDVLIVYTPFARDDAGGRSEIETLIDLRVAETNQALENSGVIQRIHNVWTAEVDYTEIPRSLDSQRTNTIEHLIDPSDGYMDEVHAMRDRYAADLVHLVVDNRFNTGGEAKRLRDLSSSVDAASRHAFTISKVHVGSGSVIFAHELGHSMGLAHDRYAELHVCCSGLNKVYGSAQK